MVFCHLRSGSLIPLEGHGFRGETLIVGIGQGYTLASPIQLANFAAIIATRGRRFVPNLVHFVGDERVFPKELASVVAEGRELGFNS